MRRRTGWRFFFVDLIRRKSSDCSLYVSCRRLNAELFTSTHRMQPPPSPLLIEIRKTALSFLCFFFRRARELRSSKFCLLVFLRFTNSIYYRSDSVRVVMLATCTHTQSMLPSGRVFLSFRLKDFTPFFLAALFAEFCAFDCRSLDFSSCKKLF